MLIFYTLSYPSHTHWPLFWRCLFRTIEGHWQLSCFQLLRLSDLTPILFHVVYKQSTYACCWGHCQSAAVPSTDHKRMGTLRRPGREVSWRTGTGQLGSSAGRTCSHQPAAG